MLFFKFGNNNAVAVGGSSREIGMSCTSCTRSLIRANTLLQ